jgi:hypothetical protein
VLPDGLLGEAVAGALEDVGESRTNMTRIHIGNVACVYVVCAPRSHQEKVTETVARVRFSREFCANLYLGA